MRPGLVGRARRLLAVLLAGSAAAPALLWAHTELRRSEPAAGAHLTAVPSRLVLEFTEIVALPTASVILRGPAGDTVAVSPLQHADSTRRVVAAELVGPPRPGAHTVEWTVAGTDGHPVRGTFRFTIDTAASGLAPAEDSGSTAPADTFAPRPPAADAPGRRLDASSPIYVAARFFGFAAILGVLGAVAAGRFVVPRVSLNEGVRETLLEGVRRFGLLSAAALMVFAAARLVLQAVALHGAWDATGVRHLVSGTIWGTGWLVQVAGALLASIAFSVRRSNPFGPTAMVAALAIALSAPLAGHPVAVPGAAPLAVALDALHVLAVGSWLGALAVLILAAIPAASWIFGEARYDTIRGLLVAFTPVAVTSAGVLVLSGAAGAWLQMGGIAPLFRSAYGRLLLVKIAIVAVVAVFGLLNWRRFVPGIGSARGLSRFRMFAGAELALGVIALLVTAVLTATTPPVSGAP